jgi:hypothetical protein
VDSEVEGLALKLKLVTHFHQPIYQGKSVAGCDLGLLISKSLVIDMVEIDLSIDKVLDSIALYISDYLPHCDYLLVLSDISMGCSAYLF